ncbi:hypothetical protein AMAG_05643 [Allomyces macrogynus ATCC 38327]|uniref:Cyclic nucleotide-binding domain-containing protein n=1 Tax=Allomyces macrogynus (strain ATCC 38327) TaxID=578462 RepID=A0A0L0SCR5_ALLM3|nr:hypothetical protein AMAG_05643 [Allomyces macrogynus ATCC 38327]|eukprot:KNE60232.1 hypothetical protein AMAG_05643 [Allomyces macrogynus ATCC 38327]
MAVPALVRANSTPSAGGPLVPMAAPPSPSTTLSHETFGSVLESFTSLAPPPHDGTSTGGYAVQGDVNTPDSPGLPSPSPARSREPSPRPTPVVSIDRAPRPPTIAAVPLGGITGEPVALDFLSQRRSSGGDAATAATASAAVAVSSNGPIVDAAHELVNALAVPSILGSNAAVRRNPSRHLMLSVVSDALCTVDEEDAAATVDAPSTPPSSSSQLPELKPTAGPPPLSAETVAVDVLTLPRSITAGVAAAVAPTVSAASLPAHQTMVQSAILPFAPADPTSTGPQSTATSGAGLWARRASRSSASKVPVADAKGEVPEPAVSTTRLAPNDLAGNEIPPSLANASEMEDGDGDTGEMNALSKWAHVAQEWYRDMTDKILRTIYRRFHDSWDNIKSNPHALFWQWWDVAIRTIHVWMLFLIPITASFTCDYLPGYVIRWFVLDLILILSTILDAVRPRVDEYGIIVTDAREKRQLFMSDWVNWAKLVACIPFDWPIVIMWANNDSLLECSGAIPVLTDGSVAPTTTTAPVEQRFMYHAHDIPVALTVYTSVRWLRLLHTTSTMFWYSAVLVPGISHLVGRLIKCLCFSFVVSNLNASLFWTMEAYCADANRYIERYLVDADSPNPTAPTAFDYRFWRNLFEAQKSLFFIPREVRATIEVKYQTFEMLAAVLIYGALFGNLAAIVRSFDSQAGFEKAAKERLARRTYLRSYLIQYRFPRELQRKLLTQEEKDWAHKKGGDADGLFKNWPKSLRAEVFTHLYLDLIAKVPLFADTDQAFRVALAERITTITVQSGFYICKAGESGSECYFIRDGAVNSLAERKAADAKRKAEAAERAAREAREAAEREAKEAAAAAAARAAKSAAGARGASKRKLFARLPGAPSGTGSSRSGWLSRMSLVGGGGGGGGGGGSGGGAHPAAANGTVGRMGNAAAAAAAQGARGSVSSVSSSLRTAMVGPPHASLTRYTSRLGNLLRSMPRARGNSAGAGDAPPPPVVSPGVAELGGGGGGSGVVGTPGSPRRAVMRAASPLRMSAVAWTMERETQGVDAEPLVPAKDVEDARGAPPSAPSATGGTGSRSGEVVGKMRGSQSGPQDDADVSINSTQFDLPPANRADKGVWPGSVPESLVTVVQSAKDLDKSKLVITSTESVRTAPDVHDLATEVESDDTDHDEDEAGVKDVDRRR